MEPWHHTLPSLFLFVWERKTVTCDTTEETEHTDVCTVEWLTSEYSECESVWFCMCVYRDFDHHPLSGAFSAITVVKTEEKSNQTN